MKPKFRRRIRGTQRQIGMVFPLRPSQQKQKAMLMKVSVPRGVRVVVSHKRHNPADIELKSLRDPHSGAPLEPAPEYGSSIMFSPYSGEFVMVRTPEGKAVKPRFTSVDEGSLKIAKTYLQKAADEVESDKSFDALKRAYSSLDAAQRVEPWHRYPEAGLQKNPVYQELKESATLVGNYVDSAASSDGAERQKWIDKGIQRILAANKAIVGT